MVAIAGVMVMPMLVAVRVHTALPVGAAFGVEWPRHDAHLAAKTPHHLGDDMIVTDVDEGGGDLRRQMAVAQMPGYARQQPPVAAGDLQQSPRGRLDGNEAPLLPPQSVARPHHPCPRQTRGAP